MAAEPPTNSSTPASYPVLPPYPELILAAIEAVDEKNGANKSSISKQIEAIYGSLPAAHSTLLSHHLNKMKASGQLVIIKNNYVKPDPNAPPRRGRGRPPKAKQALPEPEGGTVASSPRPRGRPPKPRDDLAPVSAPKEAAPSVSGRKRGRPPKLGKPATAAPPPAGGERRGRGRPPKLERDKICSRPEYEVDDEESDESAKRSKTSEERDYSVETNHELPVLGGSIVQRLMRRDATQRKGKGKVSQSSLALDYFEELRALNITRNIEIEIMTKRLEFEKEKEHHKNLRTLLVKEHLSPGEEVLKERLLKMLYG